MLRPKLLTLALLLTLLAARPGLARDLTAEKPAADLQVTVDTTDAPDAADWAAEAKKLVETWHPKIAEMLPSEGFQPPMKVKLVFKNTSKFLAYTAGDTISISADWIKKNPDDYGMVVHELVHVIQQYRPPRRGNGRDGTPGWLVEGIADYIRFYKYEPQTRMAGIDPQKASYRDAYRTTAMFLAWVSKEHDKDLVMKLNKALREGTYNNDLFKQYAGSSLDELWDAFVKDPASKGRRKTKES